MKTLTTISTIIILFACTNLYAQKSYTKNGNISFFSKSPVENITADNNEVMSVLNMQSGEMQFSLLMKSFHFKKALMEEHFNENYMESSKYPKATFKGNITDISAINFKIDGAYKIMVTGDLTIHGVTKKINTPGTITVKNGTATAASKFLVNLAEFNVEVPKLVRDNIAENIEVKVNCLYDQKM